MALTAVEVPPLVLPPTVPSVATEAHFDRSIGAWILSRYADVAAALRHPHMAPSGTSLVGDVAHLAVRDATARALSPERMGHWRTAIGLGAEQLVDALTEGGPVDLVRSFAEPWSLSLARAVTGASRACAAEGAPLARELFLAAARANDGVPSAVALKAAVRLGRLLEREHKDAGALADVQAFVALSQTLPCLLAGAWLALLQHPDQLVLLRQGSRTVTHAVEELLRFATPSRAVFRSALGDVEIGGADMRLGDRIVLMLAAANRDPAQFPGPDTLDLGRDTGAHLAFGLGTHGCAGAAMVRVAVTVATEALIRRTAQIELVEGSAANIEWVGGFAILAPSNLPVVLRR